MQETEPAQVLRYGNLEININNYDVRIDGERLPLTPKEVEIFQLLASHPGEVFSREKILSLVWGYDYYGDTRAVDTQIKRIRQKISQREEKGWTLKTVYGVGYRFEIVSEREDGTVSHENEAEDYGTDE
jgi:DNA-binding response OmpR family regulator